MQLKDLQLKRALRTALLVLLLSVGIDKMYAVTIGDLNYSLNKYSLEATVEGHKDGTSATGTLVIPSSVTYTSQEYVNGHYVSVTRTYTVTTIGDHAFYRCSGFTGSLTIPNSVTTIYDYAFNRCTGFTGSLTIPNSVTTIGYRAFVDCTGFTGSLTIPNSVITIDIDAFNGCSGFTGSLTIPNSVTYLGKRAFSGCSGFTGSLNIGNSVTTIYNETFSGCSGFTGSLTIPNSVTSIGSNAFSGCSGFTGSLTIPNSVTSIGSNAFNSCSGFTGSLTIPNSVTTIDYGAFSGCSGFTGSLTIPNSVTTIGDAAFSGCSGFTGSLIIPNSVTVIGWRAFGGCNGFTGSLTIGNSVTLIDDQAFLGCSGFTGSLTIPNSVTVIGWEAFRDCSGFTGSLTIGNSVTSLDYLAFEGCNGFTGTLTIGESLQTIPDLNIKQFSHIVVASGNTKFDSRNNCDAVIETSTNKLLVGCKNTIIPNSVTTIRDNAFSDCVGLAGHMVIPNSIDTIGYYAFKNCSGLTSLTIGNSVTSIGYDAFAGCNGLMELYYNAANVTYYNSWDLIFNCPSLLLVVFGESVESLPDCSLFGWGNSLQLIKSNATVPPIVGGSNTFSGINRNTPVIVPCDAMEAYQAAPYWSEFTSIQESEYGLAVKANPYYLGSAVIIQAPDCNSSHASVRAIPNSGCRFINWTCNGEEVSDDRNYSFDMEENMVLTANFEAHKRFVRTVDLFWSNPNNWVPAGVPVDTMSVDLQSDVIIDTDVTVGSLYIHGDHVLTIMPEATLTVTEILETEGYSSNIVIEDGGQLIHSNENVYATVKKTMKAHDENGDNWTLISSPLAGSSSPSWGIWYMLSNDYDLYYYDEPMHYWNNYKQADNSFDYLESGKGYLYANSGTKETTPNGIQIGEGTGTIGYFPFYTYYDNSISECLFRAEELTATGLSTAPLGALCWYATYAPGYEQKNINIWMANVSDDELAETSHNTSTMTLVYTGNMTPTLGWNEFVFNEGSFAWDGTSNVLICVQRNNGEYNSGVSWQCHDTDFVAMSYVYRDGTYYDMMSETYSMSTRYTRPNIVFEAVGQLGVTEYHPVTLYFEGRLQNGLATVNIPLSYTEGISLAGYNLVGNPYVHNVTSYASTNVAEGCYRMNDAQDEIIVSEISEANPLKPAEGFFVKATGENASITFNPQIKSKANHNGSIRLEITENGQLIDRIIIKKEGEPLEKLSLNPQNSKLYATNDQQELAIVPIKDNEQEINFRAAHNGTYTLRVNNEGMEVDYLHLIDNITGADVDLLIEPNYTFQAKTTDYASRFRIVFSVCRNVDVDEE